MHRRRVLDNPITYIGLDVHKDAIAVVLAEAGRRSEVREYGKIANAPTAVKALATKLSRGGNELRFCYEAGPCGYGIQRQLTLAGHECVVVAPSLISRKPGDRIKTDRRDAISLAKLHRAGELTAVWVPDPAHEAIRDLVRARLAAVRSLRGLIDSWCKSLSYNGVIRARSNSTPARPYMARLRGLQSVDLSFGLLVAPGLRHSVPHRLQVLAYRLRKTLHRVDPRRARIDQPSVQPLRRSTAKQASKLHRQAPHRCELGGRGFQRIDVGDLPDGHLAAGFDAKRRRG